MPKSAPPARPTDEQLKIAGRLWNRALARQAQALLWMGITYPLPEIEKFAELPWEELGQHTQNQVALELAAFIEAYQKAARA